MKKILFLCLLLAIFCGLALANPEDSPTQSTPSSEAPQREYLRTLVRRGFGNQMIPLYIGEPVCKEKKEVGFLGHTWITQQCTFFMSFLRNYRHTKYGIVSEGWIKNEEDNLGVQKEEWVNTYREFTFSSKPRRADLPRPDSFQNKESDECTLWAEFFNGYKDQQIPVPSELASKIL